MMQSMTLKHNVRTRRFVEEHHDKCSLCNMDFQERSTTHLGYSNKGKLIYTSSCCVKELATTIIRHSYQKRAYLKPADDAVLWRFMDFTKFVSLLKNNALFFTRADKFEDPFEGAKGLLKNKPEWDRFYKNQMIEAIRTVPGGQNLNKSDKELLSEALKLVDSINQIGKRQVQETFINCWYENKYESEAMWKLYTTNLGQGIAIKTTYKRLYKALGRDPAIYIGQVNYIDYSQRFTGVNESFWFKRKSFEHENEVRAIIFDHTKGDDFGKIVPVDLHMLVEKVYLSPTSPDWFKELVNDVMIKYNLNKKTYISELNAQPFH